MPYIYIAELERKNALLTGQLEFETQRADGLAEELKQLEARRLCNCEDEVRCDMKKRIAKLEAQLDAVIQDALTKSLKLYKARRKSDDDVV